MSLTVAEFIEHYGTKGMRWGVRKAPDPNRSASKWKERKDKERADKAKASGQNGSKKSKETEKVNLPSGPKIYQKGVATVSKDGEPPKVGWTVDQDGKPTSTITSVSKRSDGKYDITTARKMTDEELRSAVARLQLEKQYKDLSQAQQETAVAKKKSKGKNFIDASKEIGTKAVKKAVTDVATEALKAELKKGLKL